MQSDLNQPLGQNLKPKPGDKKNKAASTKKLLAVFAVLVVFAGAGYTAFQSEDLIENPPQTAVDEQTNTNDQLPSDEQTPQVVIKVDPSLDQDVNEPSSQTSSLSSGGHVTTVTTGDGLKVTTITPSSGNSSSQEDRFQTGRSLQFAHIPDPIITEDTDFGRLPIYGQGGERAFDIYARPWSGARGTRIAIVVGGLGLSQTGSDYAIKTLPEDITLAFASTGNSLQRWMQNARRNGHEILLQVPFEPFDYPNINPGRGTLKVEQSKDENLKLLYEAMGRITNYTGIVNFMGGRFLSEPSALEPVMRDIASRGIMFFDDGTSARSLTGSYAKNFGVPFAASDITLDSQRSTGEILKKLDDLERIARANGTAIGFASAFEESVNAIATWSNEAKARGIEIVGVSVLADDPERR